MRHRQQHGEDLVTTGRVQSLPVRLHEQSKDGVDPLDHLVEEDHLRQLLEDRRHGHARGVRGQFRRRRIASVESLLIEGALEVQHEALPRIIRGIQGGVDLVQLLHKHHLDVGVDAIAGAEVDNLLGVGDAADHRHDHGRARERELADLLGVDRRREAGVHAQEHVFATLGKQDLVGRPVVSCGDGVQDKVQAASTCRHGRRIRRGHIIYRAGRRREVLLRLRPRDRRHHAAQGLRELDAHDPQSAQADDAHARALRRAVALEGVVHGDSCTEDRPCKLERVVGRDEDREALVHDHLRSIASHGHLAWWVAGGPARRVLAAIRAHPLGALLLLAHLARSAVVARVDEAADTHLVADFDFSHLLADCDADAGQLMAGNAWVLGPFADVLHVIGGRVQVAVADTAKLQVDKHVLGAQRPALEAHRLEVARLVVAGHAERIYGRHGDAGRGAEGRAPEGAEGPAEGCWGAHSS
mmetsp:Transcript_131796/g.421717  ORF Transcript_131796/g.421717 Transcript_131796/m.421717 type:complete len:470 (-) Transcript_131796:64-1473(-)